MKKYFRLYMKFVSQYLKTLMEYKADFLIGLLSFFIVQSSGIVFIYLVFAKIPSLNGWSFDSILFIYGFAQIPRGIDHLISDNFWLFSGTAVRRGTFDRYLLRPINPLFQVLAEVFQVDALGELIVGTILLVTATVRLKISITLLDILLFAIVVICGTVIYFSIKLFVCALSFWIKRSNALLTLTYNMSDFSKYPMSIYSKFIRVLLTFILPFGFTAFFPASYFINKMSITISIGGTIIAAIISFTVAYATWNAGINRYESAGN